MTPRFIWKTKKKRKLCLATVNGATKTSAMSHHFDSTAIYHIVFIERSLESLDDYIHVHYKFCPATEMIQRQRKKREKSDHSSSMKSSHCQIQYSVCMEIELKFRCIGFHSLAFLLK